MAKTITRVMALNGAAMLAAGTPMDDVCTTISTEEVTVTPDDLAAKLKAVAEKEREKAEKAKANASKAVNKAALANEAKAREIAEGIAEAGVPVRSSWIAEHYGLLSTQKVTAVVSAGKRIGVLVSEKMGKNVAYRTPDMEVPEDCTPLEH